MGLVCRRKTPDLPRDLAARTVLVIASSSEALVDLSDVLNPATDYATGSANPQDDDIHPNLAGYDITAPTWYPFVKGLHQQS